MPIKIGSTEIVSVGKIKIGSTNVTKVYKGATQIWPPSTTIQFSVSFQTNMSASGSVRLQVWQGTQQGSLLFDQTVSTSSCIFNNPTFTFFGEQGLISFQWTFNRSASESREYIARVSDDNNNNSNLFIESGTLPATSGSYFLGQGLNITTSDVTIYTSLINSNCL